MQRMLYLHCTLTQIHIHTLTRSVCIACSDAAKHSLNTLPLFVCTACSGAIKYFFLSHADAITHAHWHCYSKMITAQQCCQLSNSVARFSDFSDPLSDFFPKKRLATNLATSWTNLISFLRPTGPAARARGLALPAHIHLSLSLSLSLSASALFSEQHFQLKKNRFCFF